MDNRYPFGTKVYIDGLGTYTVQDRGGKIKGNHIDVWFPSHRAAVKFGRRRMKVWITWK
jgi:3D (Asp-Asp-Asp) domain-containing protein